MPFTTRSRAKGCRLPRELIDIILYELRSKKITLKNCALVSKSWLHTCRTHIFACYRIVLGRGGQDKRDFTDFLEFLTASPDICSYIRRLTISGFADAFAVNRDQIERWRNNPSFMDIGLVYQLPHLLINLHTLCLFDILFLQDPTTSPAPTLSVARQLKHLELSHVLPYIPEDFHSETSPTPPLLSFLKTFGDIESVTLFQLKYSGHVLEWDRIPLTEFGSPPMPIPTLKLHFGSTEDYEIILELIHLFKNLEPTAITTLELTCFNSAHIDALKFILTEVLNLEHITLALDRDLAQDPDSE